MATTHATTTTPANGTAPAETPATSKYDFSSLIAATVAIDATELQRAANGTGGRRRDTTPISETPYYAIVAAFVGAGYLDGEHAGKYAQVSWQHPELAALPALAPQDKTTKKDGTPRTTRKGQPVADHPADRFYKLLRAAGEAFSPPVYISPASDGRIADGIKAGKIAPDSAVFQVLPIARKPVPSAAMQAKRAERKAATVARKAAGAASAPAETPADAAAPAS